VLSLCKAQLPIQARRAKMNINKNQFGFSAVEVVLVLAIVGVLGYVGYFVYSKNGETNNDTATTQTTESVNTSTSATDVAEAPDIKNTSDLDKAQATLDATDPSSSTDTTQLNSQLSGL
jgi:prepilin-type N-terminal cleavage/methylation domain-containing protein